MAVSSLVSQDFLNVLDLVGKGLDPDLLFLAFLENSKENHQKSKDFFCLPNP